MGRGAGARPDGLALQRGGCAGGPGSELRLAQEADRAQESPSAAEPTRIAPGRPSADIGSQAEGVTVRGRRCPQASRLPIRARLREGGDTFQCRKASKCSGIHCRGFGFQDSAHALRRLLSDDDWRRLYGCCSRRIKVNGDSHG